MIGSKTLFFKGEDFITGMAQNKSTGVGGEFFGQESAAGASAVDLLYRPGVIFGTEVGTDKTGSLSGNLIASCWDPSQGHKQVYLGDNGKVWTWNGTALTERRDSSGTYVMGTSDMICYKGNLYLTSTTDIHRIPEATNYGTSIDETWGSVTAGFGTFNANNRHPMVVYENYLYIGDGNELHRTDGSVHSTAFLALPTGQNIVCMNIDPSTGKLLISVTEGDNASNLLPILSKVLVYDGYSNKPTRVVIVDEMVTAIYALGGVVYMAYGKNLGYWNGAGISFLYALRNVTDAQADLVYKAKISSAGRMLLVVDKTCVLAYGEVVPGKRAFFPYLTSHTGSQIHHIASLGGGVIGLAGGTAAFETVNTAIVSGGKCNFYTNMILFPKKVRVREVVVTFDGQVTTGTKFADVILRTKNATFTMSPLTNSATASVDELTSLPIDNIPPVRQIQLQFQGVTGVNPGIVSIAIRYDELE